MWCVVVTRYPFLLYRESKERIDGMRWFFREILPILMDFVVCDARYLPIKDTEWVAVKPSVLMYLAKEAR